MKGNREKVYAQITIFIDIILIFLSFFISYFIRIKLEKFGEIPHISEFIWILTTLILITPITLNIYGFYNHPLDKKIYQSIVQIFKTQVVNGLILGALVIFLKLAPQSRFVLGLTITLSSLLLLLREYIYKKFIKSNTLSKHLDRILLAGSQKEIKKLIQALGKNFSLEHRIVGMIDLANKNTEALLDILHQKNVSRVIFTGGHIDFKRIENALLACEEEGIEAWLNTDFMNTSLTRPNFDYINGKPMLVFSSTPEHSWELILKNLTDKIGSILLIIFTSPIWIITYLGIKLSSPGPVFFTQKRCGKYGKEFEIIKFRSMNIGAEKQQAELEKNNEMSGPVFKLTDDPRVFSFGKFIRKFSIDELPQLINVLLGDMSLVGPRPLPTYEIEKIDKPSQRRRLSVKPGITCIWQIAGRNNIKNFEDWVKLDLEYIDNWNISLDYKIILKTIPVVIYGSGAK